MFNRSLTSALAAMACLAENHQEAVPLTADQIAERKELAAPFLKKLLTALAQSGLVMSKPGRRGGFILSRSPREIRLIDVATSVGYRTKIECCPFGPGYGEEHEPCPMHERLCALRDQVNEFLGSTTLEGFARNP